MKKRRTLTVTAFLAALLTAGQLMTHASSDSRADKLYGPVRLSRASRRLPTPVPGRLVVKYRGGVSTQRRHNLMAGVGARIDREITRLRLQVVQLEEGADTDAYARALRERPEVESVEPDFLCDPVGVMVPDDPLYSSQWHLPAVSCPAAWGMTTGSDEITIALCDTGIDSTHPDLASKLVPGWNIVTNNADTSPVSPHGTWTAGTAAASGNNEIGVASPALDCHIMPIRVSSLASGAALLSDLAAAVVWAADHGARVASVSYMNSDTSIMTDAGRYIQSKGGVLVMAAGNTGTYNEISDASEIIVVSATSEDDSVAGFTTTGPHIDVSAPGSSILTTAPGNTYQAVNGTSFSTPLVAGAVGLMLSVNPNLTPDQIDTILKVSADDLGPAGWDSGYGWGRLNVEKAVEICQALLIGAPDAVPPAVGFSQPRIGGPSDALIGISSAELVKVNAIDDRAISSVTLAVDGVPSGEASSAPYSFFVDTSLFDDGSNHTLIASATDASGNMKTITTTVTADASFDATPPTVSFVQPQVVGGSATVGRSSSEPVVIDAQDNKGIAQVILLVDGSMVSALSVAPYSFTVDTSGFGPGSQHELMAVAADQGGNWTTLSVTATVAGTGDSSAPQVSFRNPDDGDRVNGNQNITILATDDVGVTRVELYIDGELSDSWTEGPYDGKWNTKRASKGQHSLRAVAYDAAGNNASSTIVVTVK